MSILGFPDSKNDHKTYPTQIWIRSKVRVYFLNKPEEPTTLLWKLHQTSLEITHKHTWNPRRWFFFFLPFYCRVAQRLLLLGQQVRYSHNTDHTQTEWTHLHQTAKANQAGLLLQGMWFTGHFPTRLAGKQTVLQNASLQYSVRLPSHSNTL